ncbi:YcaO-like family protein [Desulfovibrio inopinatus]|uniref:YcaO-like family protein n=1 Tax=Desulfovibrio inopinatus TaxID=102109 RepID=UPI0003F7B7FB|nr:YcaO-like family protein [Desulfovibrio inopinatus]
MTQCMQSSQNAYANHKDCSPTETIATIRALLRKVGFGTKCPLCELWRSPGDGCYSVRIWDPDYPLIGANGKGISKVYALASAYAEFIERLQCMVSSLFGRLGNIYSRKTVFHDEVMCSLDELLHDIPDILSQIVETPSSLPVDSFPCLPFWDVRKGKTTILPYYLILMNTHSTGMSAGNTPEESVCQGVCEIMERYAARQVGEGNLHPPTIPLSELPLESTGLKQLLKTLHEKGLDVVVKDCTIDGAIPVLAVIVIDRANDRFNLRFGSDPVFDVALQRCITELYQGHNELPHSYSYSYWKEQRMPLNDYFSNVHSSLSFLLNDVPSTRFREAFTASGQSNAAYLAFVLEKIHALGCSVYVRDFSFLGFPSHYVYIQGMSATSPLTTEECHFYLLELREALGLLFQLARGKTTDVCRLAEIFSRKIRSEKLFSSLLFQNLSNYFSRLPVVRWVEPRCFLAFIFIEAGLLDDAITVLTEVRSPGSGPPEAELWPLLLDYCRLASEGQADDGILARLQERYGDGTYGQRLHHLVNRHYAGFYLNANADDSGSPFSSLPMPQCETVFSCRNCKMNTSCLLSKFLTIRSALHKTYTPIDQMQLGDMVSSASLNRR